MLGVRWLILFLTWDFCNAECKKKIIADPRTWQTVQWVHYHAVSRPSTLHDSRERSQIPAERIMTVNVGLCRLRTGKGSAHMRVSGQGVSMCTLMLPNRLLLRSPYRLLTTGVTREDQAARIPGFGDRRLYYPCYRMEWNGNAVPPAAINIILLCSWLRTVPTVDGASMWQTRQLAVASGSEGCLWNSPVIASWWCNDGYSVTCRDLMGHAVRLSSSNLIMSRSLHTSPTWEVNRGICPNWFATGN